MDEEGVVEKFGVRPTSIPDWLALVGDSADGYPGIPGWGAKSSALVLSRFEHLELIPEDPQSWGLGAARAARLAESLAQRRADAQLFKRLATLRVDVPITETLEDLEWHGAHEQLKTICEQLGDTQFPKRVTRWRQD
jgi:5'-3' exonuclease